MVEKRGLTDILRIVHVALNKNSHFISASFCQESSENLAFYLGSFMRFQSYVRWGSIHLKV